jgi:predicted secreted Zn-dependent protease
VLHRHLLLPRARGDLHLPVLIALAIVASCAAPTALPPPAPVVVAEPPPAPAPAPAPEPPAPPWTHAATDAPPAALPGNLAVTELAPAFYDVEGATLTDVRASLKARRPVDRSGIPHHAITRWHADWKFKLRRTRGACRLHAIAVTLTITQTLPRRAPHPTADAAMVERWDRYERALRAHEAGHRNAALNAATTIATELAALSAPACDGLVDEANRRGQAIREAHIAIEVDYDRATRHGATTGALL